MRKLLLGAALGTCLSLAGSTAAMPYGSRTVAARPALRLLGMLPLKVQGVGFRPAEQVTLVLLLAESRSRSQARAGRTGRFVVTFRGVGVDRCTSFTVAARGDQGSRALVRQRAQSGCPGPAVP